MKPKPRPPAPNKDQIDVLANVPVTVGPVTRFTMTRHQSRSYLYIEHASHALTIVDLTDANHPSVVANLDTPASGVVLTAAGDAALIASDDTSSAAVTPQPKTMTIVSFADRAHPQTIRQFEKVTCTTIDNSRGLVISPTIKASGSSIAIPPKMLNSRRATPVRSCTSSVCSAGPRRTQHA